MLIIGQLSPRLVAHARDIFSDDKNKDSFLIKPRFLKPRCRLRDELLRRQWHHMLSNRKLQQSNAHINERFQYWRGYVQRIGVINSIPEPVENSNAVMTPKPLLAIFIHGFGGSLDQFSDLGQKLTSSGIFDVLAVDSIGFGYSEKPPLSYNQYLWTDQVL
jgi:pimeloyl-ACP methyl ester carboxylesterase